MSITVTDHALVRYLERVKGVPTEAIRDLIAGLPGLAEAVALGARSFSHGGFTYRIRGGAVTTIEPGEAAQAAYRNATRHKGGRVKMRNLDNGGGKATRRRLGMAR